MSIFVNTSPDSPPEPHVLLPGQVQPLRLLRPPSRLRDAPDDAGGCRPEAAALSGDARRHREDRPRHRSQERSDVLCI
jgi:hypothetical protein